MRWGILATTLERMQALQWDLYPAQRPKES